MRSKRRASYKDELPSAVLLIGGYGAYLVITAFAGQMGSGYALALLVPVLVLHSSLQHEFIHGHPTRYQWLNDLLVSPAIGLLVPYLRFKDMHLAHHHDPNLTDPYDDPESNFLDPVVWSRLPKWRQMLCNFNNTLFGRMLIGPALGLLCFYSKDMSDLVRGNRRIAFSYGHHLLGLLPICAWHLSVSTLPLWAYGIAAYVAISVLKIRTFLEHKAHERASARTVLIEDRGILSLLFLNNNYHAIHHSHPGLVWHKLPEKFHSQSEYYLRRNGGYWYKSYGQVLRLYFFTRKDPVAHPLMDRNGQQDQTARDSEGLVTEPVLTREPASMGSQ